MGFVAFRYPPSLYQFYVLSPVLFLFLILFCVCVCLTVPVAFILFVSLLFLFSFASPQCSAFLRLGFLLCCLLPPPSPLPSPPPSVSSLCHLLQCPSSSLPCSTPLERVFLCVRSSCHLGNGHFRGCTSLMLFLFFLGCISSYLWRRCLCVLVRICVCADGERLHSPPFPLPLFFFPSWHPFGYSVDSFSANYIYDDLQQTCA